MQTLNQNALAIIATDLVAANKKSVIRVLHVDDDPSILEISKLILIDMESSLDIDNACCVDEAFKKMSTINYDVVVSDYEMSQKNGIEFLKELREQNNKIPFILFTGKGREEVAMQALNLGADGYYNKQGSPETVYGELCHGITQTVKRNRAEKAQEKALFLSSIVEGSDDAIIGKTLDGSITSWNESAEKIYGYSEDEALGKSIQMLVLPEEKEEITQILKKIGAGEPIKHFQTRRVRKDGVTIDVSLSISPIKNEAGTIIGASTIARDITENKKIEELAVARLKRYQSFIEITGELGWVTNAAGEVLEDVPSFRNFTGQTYDEVKGWGWSNVVHPDDASAAKLAWQTAVAKKTKYDVEYRLRRFDGVYRNFIARSVPIFENGEIFEWVGICIDITERKKVEEKLRETQEKYEATFESSMDALMLLDEKGFFDCNKATLLMFGCRSVEEFTKFHPADLSPPTQPDGTTSMTAAMSHIQRAFQTGADHFFWIHKRTDGTTFSADVLLTKMSLKGREVLQATVRDITKQRETEEKIKFQADLLSRVGQAILMVDNHKTIRFWNKAAENLYGYSEEQALGHQVTELLGGTSPEEAEEVFKRLMAGESWSTEVVTKNKDGSMVPIILNRTPIYKKNGEFLGSASISTDISLQKNTEADLTFSLKSLSNSLDRIQELNEKIRVMGSLTRHDVRNKLSAVTGYAYILKKKHSDLPDVVDGLSRMEQAVRETVKIFDFAKMYEEIGAEKLTSVNVEEKLNQAVALFSGSVPTIINQCQNLTVLADSSLRQLFYNLIDNTIKYGKKTTTIRLHYEKTDQENLKLIYEDDGVGVPLENKPSLFKEGFSTGGSTGFGLFLTKKMIQVYGWTISEEGEPGKGAKFIITIPSSSVSILKSKSH